MKKKELSLKTGILVIPDHYKVIEETRTEGSDHAAVITAKNSILPHFVAFTEKPLNSMTAEEQSALWDKCISAHPEIGDAIGREHEMVFDDDWILQNVEECEDSVRVGIVQVPEDEKLAKECGIGIIRR